MLHLLRNAISFSYDFFMLFFFFSFLLLSTLFLLAHSDTIPVLIPAYTCIPTHAHTHTHTSTCISPREILSVRKKSVINLDFPLSFVFNSKCFKCFLLSFVSFFFSHISLSCDPLHLQPPKQSEAKFWSF